MRDQAGPARARRGWRAATLVIAAAAVALGAAAAVRATRHDTGGPAAPARGLHATTTSTLPTTAPSTTAPSTTAPSAAPAAAPVDARARCASADMAVSVAAETPSAPTGRSFWAFFITNRSDAACYIVGYPTLVSLLDAGGRVVPFVIRDGGGMVARNDPTVRVPLGPGQRAYFFLEKYRCDVGSTAGATTARLRPPGSNRTESVAINPLAYCGKGDSGSIVNVSAVQADWTADRPG